MKCLISHLQQKCYHCKPHARSSLTRDQCSGENSNGLRGLRKEKTRYYNKLQLWKRILKHSIYLHPFIKSKLKESLQKWPVMRIMKLSIFLAPSTQFSFEVSKTISILLFATFSFHNYLLKTNLHSSSSLLQISVSLKAGFPWSIQTWTQGSIQHSLPAHGSKERGLWLKSVFPSKSHLVTSIFF